jgi:hypothetical protein
MAECVWSILPRMTAMVCGYSFFRKFPRTYSFPLSSLPHIVQPAGPPISSMMSPTRSSLRIFDNIGWVLTIEPNNQPIEETCSANSTNNRSAALDLTLPRPALRRSP